MKTITEGEQQPSPCSKCNDFFGYQVVDNVRGQYVTVYNADGSFELGLYGDSMTTTKQGARAHCANCGEDLKLKIKRI